MESYLTGSGSLTILETGSFAFSSVNFENTSSNNSFNGTIVIDTVTNSGAGVRLASGNVFGNATVDTGPTGQKGLPVQFYNGVSEVSFGGLAGTGNFTLANNNTAGSQVVNLTVGGNNANTTYAGILSGTDSSLIKVGTGTLCMTNSNALTGTLTILGGALQFGDNTGLGSANNAVAMTNNALVIYNRTGGTTPSYPISGTGAVSVLAGGVNFNHPNTYQGGTTIADGTPVNIGADASLGTGPVANAGVINANGSAGFMIPGIVSGAGTINQNAGTTILAGNNTMTGKVNVNGGTLQVGNGGPTGSLGTATVVNNSTTGGVLAFNHTNPNLLVSGAVSGTGAISHLGSGTTTLASYQGTGPINVSNGQLGLTNTNGVRLTLAVVVEASAVTVTNAATLDLANHDLIIRSGDVNAISNLLYNGFDSGDWLGTAGSANITSSTAANDPKGVTGIGVMPADFYINDLGNDVGDGTGSSTARWSTPAMCWCITATMATWIWTVRSRPMTTITSTMPARTT